MEQSGHNPPQLVTANVNGSPRAILATLIRHRSLLWQFTLRNLTLEHKGSYLGLAWTILNPIFMMLLFTLIFGYIFNARYNVLAYESRVDFALGIFLSLIVYNLTSDALTRSPRLILGYPSFVKKVVFPLEILTASTTLASVINFGIGLVVVLVGAILFGQGLSLYLLYLPVIILPVILMSLGLAWLLSALGVYLRDISQMTQVLNMALLYLSAIFYSVTQLPARLQTVLMFNPVVHAVEQSRNVVLWHHPPEWGGILYLYLAGGLVFLLGYNGFIRMRPGFADVI